MKILQAIPEKVHLVKIENDDLSIQNFIRFDDGGWTSLDYYQEDECPDDKKLEALFAALLRRKCDESH
jgi:hypothetical protein